MIKQIKIQDNQNLWDIALQEFGGLEGIFYLLLDNPSLSVDSELSAGQTLNVSIHESINSKVVDYYSALDYSPASGSFIFTPVTIPPPPPTGGDGIAKNSNNSYSEAVPTGTILNLPDSTITINGALYTNLPATNDLSINVVDQSGKNVGKKIGGDYVADAWVRNPEWLNFNDPTSDGMVGLYAVYPTGKGEIRMRFIIASGYTVDWGDGTVLNYASGVTAVYTPNYNSIPASSLTSDGYKQIVIKVTPQVPGEQFTGLFSPNYVTNERQNWLDMASFCPQITQFYGGSSIYNTLLERFRILGTSPTANFQRLFQNSPKLKVVEGLDFNTSTNSLALFYLTGLEYIGDIIINSGSVSPPDFSLSVALKEVGDYFYNGASTWAPFTATSLRKIGDIAIPNVTNVTAAFRNSYLFKEFGNLVATSVTIAQEMFRFTDISEFQIQAPNIENIRFMFDNCWNLRTVVFDNCSNINSTSAAFNNCFSLAHLRVPNIKSTFVVSNTDLDRDALIQVFNDLGTVTTTQSINISSTPGASNLTSADLLIATNKGWAVIQ